MPPVARCQNSRGMRSTRSLRYRLKVGRDSSIKFTIFPISLFQFYKSAYREGLRIRRRFGARTDRREASYEWATSVDVNLPLHLSHPTPCCWCSTHGNLTTLPPTHFQPPPPSHAIRVRVCVCVHACVPLLALTPDQLFRWPKRRKKSASGRENVKRANANLWRKNASAIVLYTTGCLLN